ncbi:MAG: leucine-rich repeat protein [Muribaculaceae bacterium]|nr:leucine-rich repeat protein [Muribaculaceae bacterium]
MKRLKFHRTIVAIAMMLIGWLPSLAHDFEVDGIFYDKLNSSEVAVTYKGYSYDSYSNEYIGDVVIPSSVKYNGVTYSVTSIGYGAFYDCSGLTSVVIGNSVTSIGNYAFFRCSSLTSIEIPNSVTSIGDWAFYYCKSLTSIEIPNSVTSIGLYAFGYCSSLTSIQIPNSVTSIGDHAFSDCLSLTSIQIPNSVTSIGLYAFGCCSSLTSIQIPNSVTSIGDNAFSGCYSLTSIEIPNSVTSIGNWAFSGCSSLTKITCLATNPPTIYYNTFNSYSAELYVPAGCISAYQSANYWEYFNIKEIVTLSTSIALNQTTATLKATETLTLVATILPENTTDKSVTWASSNTSVATVDANGKVTAVAVGETTITATTTDGSNLSASCKVTVAPTLAESIALDKTEISLEATETATLVASVLPELTTDKSVEWSSSDEAVVIVDANGLVTAIAVGEATITATTTDDSNKSATCKVTVVPTLAETITLDKTEISLEATETATLVATILPNLTTDKSVEWSSSDESVAVVDENGVVTAISIGEAVITATTADGSNLSASCKVSVIPTLAVSIELDQTEASVEEKSEFQLTATILPKHTTNKEVAWSSSDKWVASVDNTGLVTMYSAGEVIITATTTDGTNLSATCNINVYSGIDGVEGDDVIVATVGDNIVVKNAQLDSVVNVYASNGAMIASEVATEGDVIIEAPVKGVYVVKVGKQTVKVII